MSTGLYERVQGPAGLARVYDPLPDQHPFCEMACLGCGLMFAEGDRTVLVPIGPGDSVDGQAAALRGGYYNSVCVVVHAQCAGREEDLPAPLPQAQP